MIEELPLHGAKVISSKKMSDSRGWFLEAYKKSWNEEFGIPHELIFDCCSFNQNIGTLRGLHSQQGADVPGKLLRVLSGKVQDVLVDARQDSPTYGKYVSVELSAENAKIIYIPRGFYHGFLTLEPNTLVYYKVDSYYNPATDCGIAWDDPSININWALKENLTISARDQNNSSWENAYKY
jgi:dTDP-4-dehydrorhamnose 3,5-epimerase